MYDCSSKSYNKMTALHCVNDLFLASLLKIYRLSCFGHPSRCKINFHSTLCPTGECCVWPTFAKSFETISNETLITIRRETLLKLERTRLSRARIKFKYSVLDKNICILSRCVYLIAGKCARLKFTRTSSAQIEIDVFISLFLFSARFS